MKCAVRPTPYLATLTTLLAALLGVGCVPSGGAGGGDAAPIEVPTGIPTKLVFSTQPSSSAVAGANLATQPIVQVLDAANTLVSTDNSTSVTLAAFTNSTCTVASSATIQATTNPVTASAGVATFAGVNHTKAETLYIRASAAGLTSTCSSLVTISAAAANKLAFSTQPSSSATASTNFVQPPVVQVRDAYDNLISSDSTTSVTLGDYTDSGCTTGAPGTLSASSNPLTVTSGVASFSNVQYNTSGTIYIRASAAGLTSACSTSVTVSGGVATKLAFFTQPHATGTAGVDLTTQPVVEVQDASSARVTSASNSITIVAYTDASCTVASTATINATTNPLSASSGLATFSGVDHTKAEVIYIGASAAGLTSACSSAVTISAAAASKLAFSTQPSTTATANTDFVQQPVVQVRDAYDNLITGATNSILLEPFTDNICTVASTGTLSATTNPLSATAGVSTFGGVKHDKAEVIYVKASTAGLTSACSSSVTVSAGAATKLGFATQPHATGTAGVDLTTQPAVEVLDASNNRVTSASDSITIAAYTDAACTVASTATINATTNPVSASSGLATFAGVNHTKAEALYIRATAAGLTSACSTVSNISHNTATKVAYTTQPSTTATAGTDLAIQPVVAIQDAYNNTVTSDSTSTIALAAYTDSGCTAAASGTLNGNSMTAASGVGSFTGVDYTKAETIWIKASTGALTTACTASSIVVSPGTATQLGFTTHPSNSTGGIAFGTQPVVTAYDAYMNVATGYSGTITLAIDTNPGSDVIRGTVAVAASSGVSTYSGTWINIIGTGYTLQATAAGLSSATSNTFNITVGSSAASCSTGAAQCSSITYGGGNTVANNTAFAGVITITLTDAGGNFVSGVSPQFSATDTNTRNTYVQNCTSTNGSGVSTCTNSLKSYHAEVKTLSISSPISKTGDTVTFTSGGVNLEAVIDLVDRALSSNTSAVTWDRTRTSLDTGDYDGTVTYTFEVVAENTHATNAETIDLYNSAGASVASINIPANTSTIKRFSTTFTPTAGANNYRVRTSATASNGDMEVWAARILVKQVGATTTKLYIPLGGRLYNSSSTSTTSTLDSLASGTYGQGTAMRWAKWRKDVSSYADIAAGSPWTFEAVISNSSGGSTAYASLFNATDSTQVTASEITTTSASPTLVSASFANNATNFDDLDEFEVRIKRSANTGQIHKAGLWVKLTNLTKGEVYRRISLSFDSEATTTWAHQRIAIDTDYYKMLTVSPNTTTNTYLEVCGNRASGTLAVDVRDEGTSDTSVAGSTVGGSSTTLGSTTKTRTRSGTLTMAAGGTLERYVARATCTSCTTAQISQFSLVTTFEQP